MNEKEQNLYDSLMNVSRIATENLKELETWKDLAIGRGEDIKRLRKEREQTEEISVKRAKEINRLVEKRKEDEERAYTIVLYWYRKYTNALKASLNETDAYKKSLFSRKGDEYLNKYVGANQIYEAIFGFFRIRPDDYTSIYGKAGDPDDKRK